MPNCMCKDLKSANAEILRLKRELESMRTDRDRMAEKEVFHDAVSETDDLISIRSLAKLLNRNGVDIGGNRLFEWLRDNGYLIKYGEERNQPTQAAINAGLFELVEKDFELPYGGYGISTTTKVTGKGQAYFIKKFLGASKAK